MLLVESINPLYSASGFVVGALVGLTGVGGGALMTPLLVLLFGIHPATAIGTDLLYAAATKGAGTVVHGLAGTVDWRVTRRLAAGSVPASVGTLALLWRLGITGGHASALMTHSLGVAVMLTAVAMVLRTRLAAWAAARFGEPDPGRARTLTVVTGVVLGVLVSLTSVGAGAIGVTALLLLYPRLPTARIVGSDIAHAVPLTLVAGAGHWLLGSVDFALLGSLLVGSIPGIIIGSRLSAQVPDMALRLALAGVLVVVGWRLLA